jgi:TolA-binding protein
MRRMRPLVLLLMLLVSWGCHKKSSAPVPLPAPVTSPTPPETSPPIDSAPPAVSPPVIPLPQPVPLEPAPISKSTAKVSNLDLGEKYFRAGNFPQAARAYEAYLKSNPKSNYRDMALFYMGLSRALSGGPNRDPHQGEVALKQLVAEFPKSPYKSQAEFILVLQAQIDTLRVDVKERDEKIKQLSDELQKLKEIDMQRRPSRPSGGGQ